MKLVPILEENIDFIRLDLTRHYLQIDCDFTCFIVLNPSGNIPNGGTDICALHVGAWQIDAWKFLTKDFAQIPGFSACLVWDKTLVTDVAKAPQVAESDIDTANSISSLKGQPVNITGFSMAEGEALPVASLDETWVNIKSYDNIMDDSFNILPVGSRCWDLLIGDEFPIELISKIAKIEETETGFKISPLFCICIHENLGYNFAYYNHGEIYFAKGDASSWDAIQGKADITVDIGITDNVISSITFNVLSGCCNVRSVSTVGPLFPITPISSSNFNRIKIGF